MVHENKKRRIHYILLAFGLYFLPQVMCGNDSQNLDIVNEAVYNKKVNKEPNKKQGQPKKKSTKKTIAASEKKNFPNKIDYQQRAKLQEEKRKIKTIHVKGNKVITKDSIVHRLPLKVGDLFNVNYTATMIKNLYKTGYFHQVKIYAEPLENDNVDLHIIVQEKPRIQDITFTGNKAITSKELKEELKLNTVHTLVKEEVQAIVSKIKKLYQKKNYHNTEVTGAITPTDDGHVNAKFDIKEGKKSYLTQVMFKGNKHVSNKKLKRIILSKEDWLLGMIDRSGVYNPEMLEGDKYMIEDAYKSNGFVHAKVINTDVQKNNKTGNYDITYNIYEGDRYIIKEINAPGNDKLSEQQLKAVIPIVPGQFYSQEKIRNALENLKMIWGEYGYLFADIDPIVDINEKDKTVSLTFNSDLKDQVYLNRLTIKGNQKTKDSVLRRSILLDEGELITNRKMEISKSRVNILNYFDPKNGVNWKTTRIDDTHADLELLLKEVKTGHFNFNLGYGGSPSNRQTPQTGLNLNISAGDRNLGGSGIATSSSIELSKRYRAFNINLVNPWLFDKPIRGSLNAYVKKSEYDNVDIAQNHPFERAIGGSASLGYVTPKLNGMLIEGVLAYEKISYDENIKAANRLGRDSSLAQLILNQNFQEGSQVSLICNVSQDKRDGIVFSTQGHQWSWVNQFTLPGSTMLPCFQESNCMKANTPQNSRFQYFRTEIDVSWYTPLIGEHDLVLCVHGNAGLIHKFDNKQVPWKSLYHVGGPTTVRGYTYGQVGPCWKDTSLGATRAFNVNVEFIMPISSNMNTRGVIFYDGGAGWNTPYRDEIAAANPKFCRELQNNNFFYRHSVGIGFRVKSPSPLQVDFGIKLNPSKKFKKEMTQLHLNVEHAF
ncbi:MAG: outer membrane protein assembly factor BamA [Epsilonproteobacteria bacterium]|nr:outer membrane protein assembly factor BamA [Campylobacterota bacterium]